MGYFFRTVCPAYFLLCLLFMSASLPAQFYQGTNMEFGKNRIQYRDFTWLYYPSENFEVYYYIGGEPLAEYTLISCENNLKEMQQFFDYTLDDKIQVLSYLNQAEFRQSNLGLTGDEQTNIGGSAKILGSKMFTYYEGSHEKLNQQIRENIARVLFSQLMFGGDWKDVVKSSALLSVPRWYEDGIIAYAANGMNNESETFVRDLMRSGRFKSFNHFEGQDAKLIGQAFWHYIAEVYGSNVVANVLYMAQASRNIESGFLYVLGLTVEQLSEEFENFYADRAASLRSELLPSEPKQPDSFNKKELKDWKRETKKLGDVAVKYNKNYLYSQFCSSPDQSKVAFVTNELGQYRIWIYDAATQKKKCILKRDHKLDRIIDQSYPVLAWHPSGEILTYFFEKEASVWIGQYSLEEKKHTKRKLSLIEKVIDISYSSDGKKLIMSGVTRGQTDLYLYQVIGNNIERLTWDIWDDMHPSFMDGNTKVIFSSDRPDDTLRTDQPISIRQVFNKDIYVFDLENRSKYLSRITNTADMDEDYPSEYSNKHYTYLANNNGFDNRFLATIDSTISSIDTTIHYRYFTETSQLSAFHRDILQYEFNQGQGNYLVAFLKNNQPWIHLGNKNADVSSFGAPAGVSDPEMNQAAINTLRLSADTLRQGEVDIDNYVFEDERTDYTFEKETVRVEELGGKSNDAVPVSEFVLPKSRNYRLNFAADKAAAQLRFNLFNPIYQNYSESGPSSINPGLSGFTQFGISDLFEDYRVVGGFRTSIGLDNTEYGVSFENLKSRWDRRIIFSRSSQRVQQGVEIIKLQSNDLAYVLKFPFSEVSSIRIRGDYRLDRIVRQSNDLISLAEPNQTEMNVGLKLEYVFDNTINRGLNLYHGTRFKSWVERYQQLDLEERTDVNVVGFDFRHYKRIHRSMIGALRFAGVSSFGAQRIINYLGGVDNWMFQRVDNSTPISNDIAYRFQSFIGPMRGFYLNARNGNSALMANTEVRWPLFRYFIRKPIKSDFVENFQLVTFLDAGTAWTGANPYSDDNLFNQTEVIKNPVTVTISNNREPIVYGYGFGLRSRVLGYFVRADWAWGVDDGRILDRVFYLSLNMDF
jgi:Tol biopolymer transport system component